MFDLIWCQMKGCNEIFWALEMLEDLKTLSSNFALVLFIALEHQVPLHRPWLFNLKLTINIACSTHDPSTPLSAYWYKFPFFQVCSKDSQKLTTVHVSDLTILLIRETPVDPFFRKKFSRLNSRRQSQWWVRRFSGYRIPGEHVSVEQRNFCAVHKKLDSVARGCFRKEERRKWNSGRVQGEG